MQKEEESKKGLAQFAVFFFLGMNIVRKWIFGKILWHTLQIYVLHSFILYFGTVHISIQYRNAE